MQPNDVLWLWKTQKKPAIGIQLVLAFFALCTSLSAEAQQAKISQSAPEEVMIIGERVHLIRKQMMQAEVRAYDVFNQFNDEKRFNISCSVHQSTGSHFDKQTCQPGFELEATRKHAQGSLDSYRSMLGGYYAGGSPGSPPPELTESAPVAEIPAEAVIASQQAAYRKKMEQVAKEHPEFVEAIIQYTKTRKQYEDSTKAGN